MNTTLTPPMYIPRFGSLADRVMDYFEVNPDEELSIPDIAEKFCVSRSTVKPGLQAPVDKGLLRYTQNDGFTHVYTLASSQGAKPKAAAAPSPAPAHSTPAQPERPKPARPSSTVDRSQLTAPKRGAVSIPADALDFSGLKAEPGVPLAGKSFGAAGVSKWAPLFDLVKEPGLSVAIPAEWKSAVAAQTTKLNVAAKKAGQPTHYVVRLTSPTEARLWRTQ